MNKNSKIYIAGHRGLVGSALMRRLQTPSPTGRRAGGEGRFSPSPLAGEGAHSSPSPLVGEGRGEGGYPGPYTNIITRTHAELDLTDQHAVRAFFDQEKPEYVFLAAAKVGGILANNTYPAEFIHQNLAIQTNVIHEAYQAGVKRLIFLGSSCIYPRDCPQPMKEEYLLTGPLEATNRPYAVAKIAGIEMCWAYNRQYGTQYLAVMPTNLYGPGDNYDLNNSHVIPALIRKFHEAKLRKDKEAVVWGSGTPRREFLYSDDMADACAYLMGLGNEAFASLITHPTFSPKGTFSELVAERDELVKRHGYSVLNPDCPLECSCMERRPRRECGRKSRPTPIPTFPRLRGKGRSSPLPQAGGD